MTGSDFFVTNILVYAYDSHDPAKQKKAQDMLTQGTKKGNGITATNPFIESSSF